MQNVERCRSRCTRHRLHWPKNSEYRVVLRLQFIICGCFVRLQIFACFVCLSIITTICSPMFTLGPRKGKKGSRLTSCGGSLCLVVHVNHSRVKPASSTESAYRMYSYYIFLKKYMYGSRCLPKFRYYS